MSHTITEIIGRLEGLHKNKSLIIEQIRSYPELIIALKDLDSLVEMREAKVSIVLQLEYILVRLANRKNGPIFDDQMLHTVISGPPGTGKTQLGRILARIWHSLGLLNRSSTAIQQENASEVYEKAKNVYDKTNHDLVKLAREINSTARNLVLGGVNSHYKCTMDLNGYQNEIINIIHANKFEPSTENKKTGGTFKVVSRVDFVAAYTGQTAIKTEKLLNSALGGVLFIDEAYSLITDKRDSFGMEALTVMNQFMSEHADEIIIIFGGYNDLMNETIFLHQPGLKRRCNWFFDVEGYTGDGLAQIFQLQMKKHGWEIDASVDLYKFFTLNLSNFTNYGGDTEKFAFYCKLYHMDSEFVRISNENRKRKIAETNQVISECTIERAFVKYKLNRVDKPSDKKDIPFGFYT